MQEFWGISSAGTQNFGMQDSRMTSLIWSCLLFNLGEQVTNKVKRDLVRHLLHELPHHLILLFHASCVIVEPLVNLVKQGSEIWYLELCL
jgi:hypothetical protein